MLFEIPSLYMDFDGQKRAETLFELTITTSSVLGFIIGFYFQMFSITVAALGVGFIIASLISIPPWPMFRRKPLPWQKHIPFGDVNSNANSVSAGGDTTTTKANNKKSGNSKSGKKSN
ncbi:hypothetical protein RDWZM_006944 [Blomia tropicalis]|uniref:Signal peptidase complex subunit 1 n=1 Tax=Blomia tropicalis TaxID=40697 RepID=A0A9Q0MBG8_BLOTA|nr:Signal peptidase complex subunit 1 [Blomia tropicalis]KAJ6221132.1 hypothetical protein RDWZM_006944 [Blomia tropicalis]